jgi:arginyl-tRNA synthetase
VNSSFGDVSTNLVLILAKKFSKSPKEIGEEFLKEINSNIEAGKELSNILKSANLAANGFINFFARMNVYNLFNDMTELIF